MGEYSRHIRALQNALEELEKPNFLMPDEARFQSVLRECALLLKDNNYVVRVIPEIMIDVKNLRGLVALFYNELTHFHPNTIQYRDENSDLRIAKLLVNKLMEITSVKRSLAIAFAAELVRILFRHEKEFSFEPGSLYSFRIFGQAKMSWITEKAIRIYNREANDVNHLVKIADWKTERYEKEHKIDFGYGSKEEIQKLIDKL